MYKELSDGSNLILSIFGQGSLISLPFFFSLVCLTHKQLNGCFADTLLYLSQVVYKSNPFTLTLSRKDLVEYTDVSVMSIIRAIKVFKNDGLIDVSGNRFEILDFNQLLRISKTR